MPHGVLLLSQYGTRRLCRMRVFYKLMVLIITRKRIALQFAFVLYDEITCYFTTAWFRESSILITTEVPITVIIISGII